MTSFVKKQEIGKGIRYKAYCLRKNERLALPARRPGRLPIGFSTLSLFSQPQSSEMSLEHQLQSPLLPVHTPCESYRLSLLAIPFSSSLYPRSNLRGYPPCSSIGHICQKTRQVAHGSSLSLLLYTLIWACICGLLESTAYLFKTIQLLEYPLRRQV